MATDRPSTQRFLRTLSRAGRETIVWTGLLCFLSLVSVVWPASCTFFLLTILQYEMGKTSLTSNSSMRLAHTLKHSTCIMISLLLFPTLPLSFAIPDGWTNKQRSAIALTHLRSIHSLRGGVWSQVKLQTTRAVCALPSRYGRPGRLGYEGFAKSIRITRIFGD